MVSSSTVNTSDRQQPVSYRNSKIPSTPFHFFSALRPSRCVLRFPSTDICISFSSPSNTTGSCSRSLSTDATQASLPAPLAPLSSEIISPPASTSLLVQSVPNLILSQQHQQVILVATDQSNQQHQPTDNLLPLCTNIASALPSDSTFGSFKPQCENLITGPRTAQSYSLLTYASALTRLILTPDLLSSQFFPIILMLDQSKIHQQRSSGHSRLRQVDDRSHVKLVHVSA